MAPTNFERMLQLADDVFAVKNDPDQLDINEDVLQHLAKIHPATVSEYNEGNGPLAWVIVIPTTSELMHRFLKGDISEKQLFELTPLGGTYDALYLCSAMVLEEYRRKGITTKLVLDAIKKIQIQHPIKSLFVWAFTEEGNAGADKISELLHLPLFKREHH